jgi:branched-chain amino acid transport system substrate-binding protein
MKQVPRRLLGKVAIASLLAVALAACGSSGTTTSGNSSGRTASAPGVTASTITIGTDMPMTGPAAPSGLAFVPAFQAYVKYVNAHGGINGRQLILKVGNSAYDPATALSAVRQLVEQDNAFAIFDNFGTPPVQGTFSYLTQQQVPDINMFAGSPQFVTPPSKYHFELLPTYPSEAAFFASYIKKTYPQAKVAIMYQDDDFGQPFAAGLKQDLGSRVVASVSYDPAASSVLSQVTTLAASHADVTFCACIVPPSVQLLKDAQSLGWHTHVIFTFGILNEQTVPLAGALLNNTLSQIYFPPPTDTADPQIAQMKHILATYAPSAAFNTNSLFGMLSIDLMVQMLKSAGVNPTRQSLLDAITSHAYKGPWYGQVRMSATNHNAFTCWRMVRMVNETAVPFGPVSCS